MSTLAERLLEVRSRISRAATRAGRDPQAVTLIAVTKTIDAERVREAAVAGIRDVGENRVQEAGPKREALATVESLHWHLIGHLQRNKVRRAVELFGMIHSVDDLELAVALSRAAVLLEREIEALAQVNVSGEASKSGFAPAVLHGEAARLAALPALRWRGLMTIAPEGADPSALRAVFGETRRLHQELADVFDPLRWNALSMGMSDDFETAIEEGATHVRVGRAIFGERNVEARATET